MKKITITIDPDKILDINSCKKNSEEYYKNRTEIGPRPKKKVCAYSYEGKLLNTYYCVSEAAFRENISKEAVRGCCLGNILRNRTRHRIFLYEGEDIKERIERIKEQYPAFPYIVGIKGKMK